MASLGKLKILDSGKELSFSINPTDFRINRQIEYDVHPRLGSASAMVSYRSGGITTLSFSLYFDKDADDKVDVRKVSEFIKSSNMVKDESRSISAVEFSMGSFFFRGYIQKYTLDATRFDNEGEMVSLKISYEIISNGDYEEGRG